MSTDIKQAILETVEEIKELNWSNYDHIESKVTDGVCDALTRLASKL